MKSLNPRLLFPIFILFCSSCGLTDPKYVDYTEEKPLAPSATSAPSPTDPCENSALAAFSSHVEPVMSKCAACHATYTFKLQSNAAAANRVMLRSWKSWDSPRTAQKMVTFITGASHVGSSEAGALTATKLQAWLDEDNKCSS